MIAMQSDSTTVSPTFSAGKVKPLWHQFVEDGVEKIADVKADEVAALDRVCILFDGLDEIALNKARGQWKALKDAGASAQYWSEESGNWEKKAET